MANLGHGNAAVADAIAHQARTPRLCTELFYNDRRAELYYVLARSCRPRSSGVPLQQRDRAVEGALKFARAATKRPASSRRCGLSRKDDGRAIGDVGS